MNVGRADALLAAAEDARAAMRRGENTAGIEQFERHYAEMREALDWNLAEGRADSAFRLSAALVPFWMATKRVEDGFAWFERSLATGQGSDAGRARALYDHG